VRGSDAIRPCAARRPERRPYSDRTRTIPDALCPKLAEWNKGHNPLGRYRAVMTEPEENVFRREALSAAFVPR
jgi:hypothetical protein